MKTPIQLRNKLSVGRGFRMPELPGTPLPLRTFTSTYYDTPDLALLSTGVTMCRRVEDRREVWQLRTPAGATGEERARPTRSFRPPEDLTRLLFAFLQGKDVSPIVKLRTRRTGAEVRGLEGPVATVTVETVAVLDGKRVRHRFRQLRLAPTGGDAKTLRHIEHTLREAGAEDGDLRPKLCQALQMEAPRSVPPPQATAPAADHLKEKLAVQLNALLAHDPGTRLGVNPEYLHQMRVATRRLRAFLRAARPLLDSEWANALRTELAWLGSALGPVRDLDVLLETLDREAKGLDPPAQRAFDRIFQSLRSEQENARKAMLDALESDRYLKLLDQLRAAAQTPKVLSPHVALADFAAEEFRKLRKAVKQLGSEPSDAALHQVRIHGKRARYAAELAESTIGRPASRFIRRTKALQDLLGTYQDARVAEERLRSLVAHSRGAKTAFVVGRVVERLCNQRHELRAGLPSIWKKLERRGQKAWTRHMVSPNKITNQKRDLDREPQPEHFVQFQS